MMANISVRCDTNVNVQQDAQGDSDGILSIATAVNCVQKAGIMLQDKCVSESGEKLATFVPKIRCYVEVALDNFCVENADTAGKLTGNNTVPGTGHLVTRLHQEEGSNGDDENVITVTEAFNMARCLQHFTMSNKGILKHVLESSEILQNLTKKIALKSGCTENNYGFSLESKHGWFVFLTFHLHVCNYHSNICNEFQHSTISL
jgi:hypothetical protein